LTNIIFVIFLGQTPFAIRTKAAKRWRRCLITRQEVMMATDVYERLAQHLDGLPGGFPRTESGVEIRILRRLFTPEFARLAVQLTLIPEEPRVIARRAKIPIEEATQRLEEMFKKGLLVGIHRKNKPPLYMAQQFLGVSGSPR
jgi:hypothetical protein